MSRGPEAALWQTLNKGMGRRWHAQRHEDDLSAGIPDVSYGCRGADGWLELKARPKWPQRTTLHELVPDAGQREWHKFRTRHGSGRVFVLLRAGVQWALLHPSMAPQLADVRTVTELREISVWHREGPLTQADYDELAERLSD